MRGGVVIGVLGFFLRGGIRPRAKFETAEESRRYADSQFYAPFIGQWVVWAFGTSMAYNTAVSLRDTDPDTHPTPTSLGIFAVELLTIQFLNNRAETAGDRAQESDAEFMSNRNAELAAQQSRQVENAPTPSTGEPQRSALQEPQPPQKQSNE